tara:strand:+ start:485 stop:1066 length:582 start_codon:yes stop_codon:yes gene_type:complete
MRDQELIKRVQNNAPGAFDELYFAYVDRVHRHLFSIVGPDPDIDDLLQLTFVQIHRKIHTFKGESRFSTWLHRVTVNVALSFLRKRTRWLRDRNEDLMLTQRLTQIVDDPDDKLNRTQILEILHKILGQLKPKKRLVFVLYEIEGHTLEEIAEIVESSVNTVAGRLRAARQEVRRTLEKRLGQSTVFEAMSAG